MRKLHSVIAVINNARKHLFCIEANQCVGTPVRPNNQNFSFSTSVMTTTNSRINSATTTLLQLNSRFTLLLRILKRAEDPDMYLSVHHPYEEQSKNPGERFLDCGQLPTFRFFFCV
jgi:hypothetical protein